MRALSALGISPGVVHLNEGHSAFAPLELVRQRMAAEGIDAAEAIRRVAPQVVFTTHTPVPAGHDRFSAELVEEHLGPLREDLGLDYNTFMDLGRVVRGEHSELFCMTVLALKLSRRANAVSSLHGQVSRTMWRELFPERDDGRFRSGTSRTACTSIPGSRPKCAGLRPSPRPRLASAREQAWLLGSHRGGQRRRVVGNASGVEGPAGGERPAACRLLRRAARRITGLRRTAAARAQFRRADDRVRAAVRDLQAGDADAAGHRRAGQTRRRPADAGAVCVRRQISPARCAGQDDAAADRAADARPALRRKDPVPRGLRHRRRPRSRAGCGRLGQQPATSARSVRHQRPEGRVERRAQPVGARRLVGGSLRRPERVRDRRRAKRIRTPTFTIATTGPRCSASFATR